MYMNLCVYVCVRELRKNKGGGRERERQNERNGMDEDTRGEREMEKREERIVRRRLLQPPPSDWLAGYGTVLLHTYSTRCAAVVAFIYRRLLLSGASAAF